MTNLQICYETQVVVDIKREASSSPETDPNGNTLIEGGGEGGGGGGGKNLDSDESDFAEIVEEVRSPRRDLPLNSIEKALNRMTANTRIADPIAGLTISGERFYTTLDVM